MRLDFKFSSGIQTLPGANELAAYNFQWFKHEVVKICVGYIKKIDPH